MSKNSPAAPTYPYWADCMKPFSELFPRTKMDAQVARHTQRRHPRESSRGVEMRRAASRRSSSTSRSRSPAATPPCATSSPEPLDRLSVALLHPPTRAYILPLLSLGPHASSVLSLRPLWVVKLRAAGMCCALWSGSLTRRRPNILWLWHSRNGPTRKGRSGSFVFADAAIWLDSKWWYYLNLYHLQNTAHWFRLGRSHWQNIQSSCAGIMK